CVLPLSIDQERIAFSLLERGTYFFERLDAAFESTWIDEQGEACHGWVPQFLVNFQKRQFDVLPGFILEMDVIIAVSATHRRGEAKVEFEQVFWNDIGAGINCAD